MLADPRILILGEASSSVDALSEARLHAALLTAGRTSLMVAHRLSTNRHAGVVLVLEQGRIVERGRHADLVRAGGGSIARSSDTDQIHEPACPGDRCRNSSFA
jgi:ATP-binding cassette subfamily B protein